ncbi:MAG: AsmA family protein, partial [Nitrospirota bacterium]|nr:AsmA family protein [Nitrospirota bacterium]
MRRRSLIVGIGIFLVIGIFVTLAYILFPFYKADIYRESLEAGFSAALGRTVKLEGPISLTFSLQPTLILENFHVANPPWASQPHFFRADRLEIQVSLARLLQRGGLEVEKILLNGAELFLEETSDHKDNWTSQKEESSSIWSQAVPRVSIDLTKTGTVDIKDSQISYQSHLSEVAHEMAIQQASASTIDQRLRAFGIEGHWDKVPFVLELQGGRLLDLLDVKEAWPIDGTLSMNGVSAEVKGSLGGENSEEIYSLQVQIHGNRLSALNEILKTDLPDSAPFLLSADVLQNTHSIDLNNIRAKLGSSEITGQLNVQNQDTRQKIVGTLTADVIQINDFIFSTKATASAVPAQHTSSQTPEFLLPFDGDVDVTINQWQLGEIELGSSSFTTHLREKQIQVAPFQGESFGGTLKANLDIDLTHSPPRTRFTGNVKSLNFGQALQAFGVTESFTGSTDLDVMVFGNGINMQAFLKTLTVKLRTNHMTWGLADSIAKKPPPVALHQISLGVSKGGPLEIAAKGSFQKNAFKAKFRTVSLVELIKPGKPWPITLAAQMGGGVLAVKGTLNADHTEMGGMLAVSLKGKQFNELDASLPPVGPYHFMAQVTKEGPRYRVNRFQGRFGTSDLSGSLQVDTEKVAPALTGILTAKHINFKELSRPGD